VLRGIGSFEVLRSWVLLKCSDAMSMSCVFGDCVE